MRKSTALLMGVLIVAIIMVIAVTISSNTIRMLSSGTNISDWELAHQAAESGLENALIGLANAGYTDSELKYGYDGCADNGTGCNYSLPLTGPCETDVCNPGGTPNENEANGQSELFYRRDMNTIACDNNWNWSAPGWTWPSCDLPAIRKINIDVPPNNLETQYWSYKMWRNSGDLGEPGTNYTNFPLVSGGPTTGPITISTNTTGYAPAYPNNSGGYSITPDTNEYSVNLIIKPSLTVTVPSPAPTPPNTISIKYWVYADPSSSICPGIDITTGEPVPMMYDIANSVCSSRMVPPNGTKELDWSEFYPGSSKDYLIPTYANATNGNTIARYLHVFYYLKPDVNFVGEKLSVTNNLRVAKSGYFYSTRQYVIDVVGMYGNERVKIRGIFDPDLTTNRFWRANFY